MASNIKIAVIGAGSTYTPELIDGLIRYRDVIPVGTLALMDLYRWRLETVGGMAERMLAQAAYPADVILTTDRRAALSGADFVITQIRIGGMAARLIDETIPPRYGVIGQETVGPGGFAKALRTVPLMIEIARDMQQVAPRAWLINFTNPSGLVAEAVWRHTNVNVVGLCNTPIQMQYDLAAALKVDPAAVALDYVGLNHLGFVRGVKVNGQDRMAQALQVTLDMLRREQDPIFAPDLIETLGLIPSYYLSFFYHHDQALAAQRQAPQTRAERVQEIEAELLKLYADPQRVEKPALLAERGGALYSTAAVSLIADLLQDGDATHIVNMSNRSTLPDLPAEAAIEVPCRVTRGSIQPLPADPLPPQIAGLIQAVKSAEMLTIQAAVSGDKRLALQALLAHPLVPSYAAARSLLAALLTEHRDYLPQFESPFGVTL
ncbi:MAG: 6-phospho-beta-glucosidase [Chloroflexi bacterium]|nr:6-phospho-beta-glucosidase [Chloroflexota bacterium]